MMLPLARTGLTTPAVVGRGLSEGLGIPEGLCAPHSIDGAPAPGNGKQASKDTNGGFRCKLLAIAPLVAELPSVLIQTNRSNLIFAGCLAITFLSRASHVVWTASPIVVWNRL
jgi:hypothetical protein